MELERRGQSQDTLREWVPSELVMGGGGVLSVKEKVSDITLGFLMWNLGGV